MSLRFPRRPTGAALASFALTSALAAPCFGESVELPSLRLDAVLTDVAPDGTVWALGPCWKLKASPTGAAFYPFVGNSAARSLPLTFGPPSIRVAGLELRAEVGHPTVAGNRASIDYGTIVESYDLAVDAVEQTFLVRELPARGELVLTLPLATELEYRGRDQGLLFAAGASEVRYGDATIIDADGRRIGAPSTFTGAAIEIRVPAAFVAKARLPLLIDPVINPTIPVATSGSAAVDPDVAYDASTDVFFVVYERVFSSTDRDILSARISSTGSVLDTVSVDASAEDTIDPSCANNNAANQFLTVWRKDKDGLFDEIEIRGRVRSAGSATQGGIFEISTGSDNESHPVVGGTDSGSSYMVAWQENPALGFGGENIAARTVSTAAALGTKVEIGSDSDDEQNPAINKHNANATWLIVWERVAGAGDRDLRGAVGSSSAGFTIVDTGIATVANLDDNTPVVAALPTGKFVIAWSRPIAGTSGTELDLVTARFKTSSLAGSALLVDDSQVFNLTSLENASASENFNQRATGIAADGTRIAVTYAQEFEVGRVVSMFFPDLGIVGPSPVVIEAAALLGGQDDAGGPIASRSGAGGSVGRSLIAVAETDDSTTDIRAQFFDSLTPGGVTTVQTGCGGTFEPSLSSSGTPAICAPFQLTLAGFDSALLVVGTPASIPLCPGQAGCVLGATPTVVTPIPNGTFNFDLPCEPALLGFTIAVTGVELVAPGTLLAVCGPPLFTQRFRTSDTLNIDLQ